VSRRRVRVHQAPMAVTSDGRCHGDMGKVAVMLRRRPAAAHRQTHPGAEVRLSVAVDASENRRSRLQTTIAGRPTLHGVALQKLRNLSRDRFGTLDVQEVADAFDATLLDARK
jgi:hypothetical protein